MKRIIKPISTRWNNISIAKRLYSIVVVMAVLIITELLILRFAMDTLSAIRAFVAGEGTWSKAQKEANNSLNLYAVSKDERYYQDFLSNLNVSEGDRRARLEMQKEHPYYPVIRDGFIQGQIHPDDIDSIVRLFTRFYWVSYLSQSIQTWEKADSALSELKEVGSRIHEKILQHQGEPLKLNQELESVRLLNHKLTDLENEFSEILGAGSRWLEHVLIALLVMGVLSVEGVGLSLTILTNRHITKGIKELDTVALSIGKGAYKQAVHIRSRDEIGRLGESLNKMGQLLDQSYRDMESKVQDRTHDLSEMVAKNISLYEQAKKAVQMRDDFMAIASHELKTPLTVLQLQLQLLARSIQHLEQDPRDRRKIEQAKELSEGSLLQTQRLARLIGELMDLTRIKSGKLELTKQSSNFVSIAQDSVQELSALAAKSGSTMSIEAARPVIGMVDPIRVGQIITNLLSNAIKYGEGKTIIIRVSEKDGYAIIEVEDHGSGIPEEKQGTIFNKLERASKDLSIKGLGLGLFICNEIAKAHGGTLSLHSQLGQGSTFTASIPLAEII